MAETRLELVDDPVSGPRDGPVVPPPLPPDDPEAWYAPDVERQDEVHPGVVVTIASRRTEFAYRVREPVLGDGDAGMLDRLVGRLGDGRGGRPRTREGVIETMARGFERAQQRTFDRLVDGSPAARRRLRYHALARVACLGEATPYALDDRVEVVDPGPAGVAVHTGNYAPAATDLDPEHDAVDRLASERVDRYEVEWFGFEIPVVRYRERLLDGDGSEEKAAVLEPPLDAGDRAVVEDCAERLRERVGARDRTADPEDLRSAAHSVVAGHGRGRTGHPVLDKVTRSIRTALARVGWRRARGKSGRSAATRDALVYHVLREAVGLGPLTIPILDPTADGVEVDGAGEPVVLRDGDRRVPTDCRFEDGAALRRVATELAAAGGVDLEPGDPTVDVRVDHPFVDGVLRCSVGLSPDGDAGAHATIRSQSGTSTTPVDLVERGTLTPDLVALVWLCCAHRRTVLFSGPDETAGRALLAAFASFLPADARSVAVGATPSAIDVLGEPDVSLAASERDGRSAGDLLGESAALDPDVVLASEIEGESGFRALGEHVNADRGVLGETTARDAPVLVERALDRGMAPSLVCELDLVVFHRRVGGDVHVVEAVELLSEAEHRERESGGPDGLLAAGGATVCWNVVSEGDDGVLGERADGVVGEETDGVVAERVDGNPSPGDRADESGIHLLPRVAAASGRSPDAVRDELARKRRYVRYLVREGIDEPAAVRGLLADIETDEAATVERLHRLPRSGDEGRESDGSG